VNGVEFSMVAVEGGSFKMGGGRYDFEKPVHEVKLTSFSICQTEVTQELWEAVMGSNPSNYKGLKFPVENVSWDDCQTFITKLNQLTGQHFRLPTEAEWEYAARGGNQSNGYAYSGSNSFREVGWCADNSRGRTHVVATKAPNELGLYDMSGNVWEWCQDWVDGSYYASSPINNPTGPSSGTTHIVRGGAWNDQQMDCRVEHRIGRKPTSISELTGFRLAL
jgi:formylglycine-generating enzyme required for sulfatase activity